MLRSSRELNSQPSHTNSRTSCCIDVAMSGRHPTLFPMEAEAVAFVGYSGASVQPRAAARGNIGLCSGSADTLRALLSRI